MKLRENLLSILFYGLYILVSVATFRHSSLGFASIEGGSVFWGCLSALAIDVGMLLSATALRQQFKWAFFTGLVISAVASTYTQLLYSMFTAEVVDVAPGAEWLGQTATHIINLRVVLLPALLPLLSIVYAFSAKNQNVLHTNIDAQVAQVVASTASKRERARKVWELAGDQLTIDEVAQLAGCHPATARRARKHTE